MWSNSSASAVLGLGPSLASPFFDENGLWPISLLSYNEFVDQLLAKLMLDIENERYMALGYGLLQVCMAVFYSVLRKQVALVMWICHFRPLEVFLKVLLVLWCVTALCWGIEYAAKNRLLFFDSQHMDGEPKAGKSPNETSAHQNSLSGALKPPAYRLTDLDFLTRSKLIASLIPQIRLLPYDGAALHRAIMVAGRLAGWPLTDAFGGAVSKVASFPSDTAFFSWFLGWKVPANELEELAAAQRLHALALSTPAASYYSVLKTLRQLDCLPYLHSSFGLVLQYLTSEGALSHNEVAPSIKKVYRATGTSYEFFKRLDQDFWSLFGSLPGHPDTAPCVKLHFLRSSRSKTKVPEYCVAPSSKSLMFDWGFFQHLVQEVPPMDTRIHEHLDASYYAAAAIILFPRQYLKEHFSGLAVTKSSESGKPQAKFQPQSVSTIVQQHNSILASRLVDARLKMWMQTLYRHSRGPRDAGSAPNTAEAAGEPWSDIATDLIAGFPGAVHKGKYVDAVLSVRDKYSRSVRFYPVQANITAQHLANVLSYEHVPPTGDPSTLQLGRGPALSSTQLQSIQWPGAPDLKIIDGSHPGFDSVMDKQNSLMEQYLQQLLVNNNDWPALLNVGEYVFNSQPIAQFQGKSAHEKELGYAQDVPRYFGIAGMEDADDDTAEALNRQLYTALAAYQAAFRKPKLLFDGRSGDLQFRVGEHVYVHRASLAESEAVFPRSQSKFTGPFKIAEIFSPVSYRLEMPALRGASDVFHISQLRLQRSMPKEYFARV